MRRMTTSTTTRTCRLHMEDTHLQHVCQPHQLEAYYTALSKQHRLRCHYERSHKYLRLVLLALNTDEFRELR